MQILNFLSNALLFSTYLKLFFITYLVFFFSSLSLMAFTWVGPIGTINLLSGSEPKSSNSLCQETDTDLSHIWDIKRQMSEDNGVNELVCYHGGGLTGELAAAGLGGSTLWRDLEHFIMKLSLTVL